MQNNQQAETKPTVNDINSSKENTKMMARRLGFAVAYTQFTVADGSCSERGHAPNCSNDYYTGTPKMLRQINRPSNQPHQVSSGACHTPSVNTMANQKNRRRTEMHAHTR